jgi:hypothetical protein
MWWFVGLIAALAACSSSDSRNAAVPRTSSSEDSTRTLTYRSRDGSAFFRFQFSPVNGEIRIHILEFPNIRIGSCHILRDHRGPFICWSGAIRSLAAAKAVATIWAESTLIYQRTGRGF